jgi:hypothetical protein
MRDRTKRTLTITMENLTEAQEIALNDLFATWQQLGSWGSSRDTTFFADGDGDFRPKITINGAKPKFTELIDRDRLWTGDHYRIDFDWIGWALAAIEERENPPKPYVPTPVDWSKPHHFMAPEGWNSSNCPDCGKDYNDPIHLHGGQLGPPETAG